MKVYNFFLVTILTCSFIPQLIKSQTTIILKPGPSTGKDAYIESIFNTLNFGTHDDFASIAWTNSGNPVLARGLIEFDLSSIPAGATITNAFLSLYSYNSPHNQSHSTLSGSNESVIQRITTSWDENTVTWNNQPNTTTQNQVFLPASASSIQHYLNIDVTKLAQDIVANPTNSYGFMLKLVNEQYYRKMVFASSDNPNSALHPTLKVCFN